MAKQIDELNKIITKYDKDGLLIGEAACTNDLVNITTVDFQVVNAISIVAIFIIIAIVEKSITLPIILVAVIELAIFINLGIPHLMGESLPFITPICISTIQLGATVDYAILMTTRYKKERYLETINAPRLLRLLKLQFRQLSLVQWDSLPLQSASHSTRMLTLFHQSVSSLQEALSSVCSA